MAHFFPRHAVDLKALEPPPLRRFSFWLVGMAVLAGILVRGYRWVVLTYADGHNVWLALATFVGGVVLLLGFATAYLGNHPVGQWVWRAPAFVLIESATETVASAALIAFGVERLGTEYAHWRDLPSLAVETLTHRMMLVLTFALLLAGVVQAVRYLLLKYEHRDTTAMAIHEAAGEGEGRG